MADIVNLLNCARSPIFYTTTTTNNNNNNNNNNNFIHVLIKR